MSLVCTVNESGLAVIKARGKHGRGKDYPFEERIHSPPRSLIRNDGRRRRKDALQLEKSFGEATHARIEGVMPGDGTISRTTTRRQPLRVAFYHQRRSRHRIRRRDLPWSHYAPRRISHEASEYRPVDSQRSVRSEQENLSQYLRSPPRELATLVVDPHGPHGHHRVPPLSRQGGHRGSRLPTGGAEKIGEAIQRMEMPNLRRREPHVVTGLVDEEFFERGSRRDAAGSERLGEEDFLQRYIDFRKRRKRRCGRCRKRIRIEAPFRSDDGRR